MKVTQEQLIESLKNVQGNFFNEEPGGFGGDVKQICDTMPELPQVLASLVAVCVKEAAHTMIEHGMMGDQLAQMSTQAGVIQALTICILAGHVEGRKEAAGDVSTVEQGIEQMEKFLGGDGFGGYV